VSTTDILRGELERQFELDELFRLSSDLLGLEPEGVGGTDGKGAFAHALVERCVEDHALLALADAMLLSKANLREEVRQAFEPAGAVLAAGTRVGPFVVGDRLGEGGVGVVYRATRGEGEASETVAIKVLHPQHARNKAGAQRWLTVARALKAVDSPHLAAAVEVGVLSDGRPWVAAPFVEGETLEARIERAGPVHYNELRPIVRGVLIGLEALHARGIVHGDVKTENVVVLPQSSEDRMTNEPTGVLLDAGADRLLARSPFGPQHTGLLPVFGSAKAIAPEQARGGRPEEASDIYAVGCLLFQALAGRPPFQADAAIDVVAAHLTEAPPSLIEAAPQGWVSPAVEAAVMRALAKDPKDRWPTAAAFRQALEGMGRASIPPAARETAQLDPIAFQRAAEALRADPTDARNAAAVEAVVEKALAWPQALELFQEVADGVEDIDAKKALFFRVARIQEQDLVNRAAAQNTYREILELDAGDAVARSALEELKRQAGEHEGLVELLLERVENEEDGAARAAVLREIAQTYERRLDDDENAFVAYVQALAEDPRDDDSIRAVERLAGDDQGLWTEAVTALNEGVEHTDEAPTKLALFNLMGRWYSDRLGRPDFALPCYGQALALDPANETALAGTIGLYRKAQSWQELMNVLLQRAEATNNPLRARDYRAEAADVLWRKLNQPDEAQALFEQVAAEDPTHPVATEALEAMLQEKKAWGRLASLLDRKAKNQRGAARVETLTALAELYEDRLEDLDKAQAHYEAAVKADPSSLVALKGLDRLFARLGKYPEQMANLQAQLDLAPTPRQRIALLERMAGIEEEEFVDDEKAAEYYQLIVEIEPGHDGANGALARIYKKAHRFDELAATLERHAAGSDDVPRTVDLLLRASKVLMRDVGAPERALAVVERAVALDGDNAVGLDLAATLRAQVGDAAKAVEATEKLVDAETDPAKKVELVLRAGKTLEDNGDNDGAIERYKRALDLMPQNRQAAEALRSLYAKRGDAQGAADLLQREIALVEGDSAKAKLWAALGELRRSRLEDEVGAREAFQTALDLDPTCTPAARGRADLAYEQELWSLAGELYEPLLARTDEMDPADAREVALRCGDAFRALGDSDKAERAYLSARAIAPADREIMERLADLAFRRGGEDAAELYQEILEQFGDDLAGPARGRVLLRLGESLERAGQHDAAEANLKQALELLPTDPAPPTALVALYRGVENWEAAADALEVQAAVADGDDGRLDALVQLSELAGEKLGDEDRASKALLSALEVRADDRNLLTKLMAVYSRSEKWSRLVDVVLRITKVVQDDRQLALYYNTAASITHLQLGDGAGALDYYLKALEHDPRLVRALDEGVVPLMSEVSDFAGLEGVYRRQLKRLEALPGTEAERAHLLDGLGALLETELDRAEDAVDVYREAQRLDPSDRERAEMLADRFADHPGRFFAEAVRVHGDLLQLNPYRIESYQALRKLYTEAKQVDAAWCVCQALVVLKNASPDEEAYFTAHRSTEPVAGGPLDAADWDLLRHPDQDPLLTDILAQVTPAVLAERASSLESLGVSPGQLITDGDGAMVEALRRGSALLGTSARTYDRPGDPGGLSFLFTNPPGIGLGAGARAGGPAAAVSFLAARQLGYLRPGHFVRMMVPTIGGLRAWLLAAVRMAVPSFPVPGKLAESVEEHLDAIEEHLAGPQADALEAAVGRLLEAAPELDMRRWVSGVDLTADRCGLLLGNDLGLATAVLKASPEGSSSVAQSERLRSLHQFAVSEGYFALRERLGIALATL
jgi:tetratricopeptide (TPR) repeat protein